MLPKLRIMREERWPVDGYGKGKSTGHLPICTFPPTLSLLTFKGFIDSSLH